MSTFEVRYSLSVSSTERRDVSRHSAAKHLRNCFAILGLSCANAHAQTLPSTAISVNNASKTYTDGTLNVSTAVRVNATANKTASLTFSPASPMSVTSPTNTAIQISASGAGANAQFTINSGGAYGVAVTGIGNFSYGIVVSGTSGGVATADLGSGTTINTGGGSYGAGLWATSGGTIVGDHVTIRTNGAGAQGVGAIGGGSILLTNSSITTSGAYGDGLLNRASHGAYEGVAALDFKDGTVSTSGDEAYGVNAKGNGGTILHNTAIRTTGSGSYGINLIDTQTGSTSIGSPELSITSDSTGTPSSVMTSGASAHAIVLSNFFAGDSATLTASGTQFHAQGVGAYGLYSTGVPGSIETASFSDSTIQSDQSDAIHVTGPDALITLSNGTSIIAGQGAAALSVNADGTSAGYVTLTSNESKLTGSILSDTLSTANVQLLNGSMWNMTANSNMTTLENDASTIDVTTAAALAAAPMSSTLYKTLSVSNRYFGADGVLAINTYLNAGGALTNQFTDRMLIGGSAAGTTFVDIKAVDGSPGPTTSPGARVQGGANSTLFSPSAGISVIQAAGASTQTAFALKNGYATAEGLPFQYHMYAYGPGSEFGSADPAQNLVGNSARYWDYRLQTAFVEPNGEVDPTDPGHPESIPSGARVEVAPQVASYLTAPVAMLYSGLVDIDTLHRRLGEIRNELPGDLDGNPNEVFLRGYGGHFDYASNVSFQNFGYNADGQYSAVQLGGNLVRLRGDDGVWRFGAAGTMGWLTYSPEAIDGPSSNRSNTYRLSAFGTYQSRQGWYMDAILSAGWLVGDINTLAYAPAMSVHGNDYTASFEGGYPLAITSDLNIEPQLQVVGTHASFSNATDADGLPVNIGSQNQVIGRLGARVTDVFDFTRGRISPYAAVDILHAFVNGTVVQVGDASFTTGKFGDALSLSLGVNGTIRDKASIYGRISWQNSIGNVGFRAWLFNAGVRWQF